MGNFIYEIAATEDTPLISISNNAEIMQMKGVSMPENAFEFFDPIEKKTLEILGANQNPTILEIELNYMNSSSNKQILKLIKSIYKVHSSLKIKWIYDSKDALMKIKGSEFVELCKPIPFELTEVN